MSHSYWHRGRFITLSPFWPYASSLEGVRDHIEKDPQCEVGCLVVFKCNWFPISETLGICHFRRSWSNRIILDYLAVHPLIAKAPPGFPYEVGGVGLGLLYFVSTVARYYECDAIWGEATSLSWSYYEKHFKLQSVKDLIYVPRANFLDLISLIDRRDATAVKAQNEMYDFERSNPPFVGSKITVSAPTRQIVHRFLKLPDHVQEKIADRLGLRDAEDRSRTAEDQVRLVLQRAKQQGKLGELWSEVESHYTDGKPEVNPFRA